MKKGKLKTSKSFVLLAFMMLLGIATHYGQGISGTTSVTLGQSYSYYLYGISSPRNTNWSVPYGGTVTSSTSTTATILWSTGVSAVLVNCYDSNNNYRSFGLTITLASTVPSTPAIPTIFSESCTSAVIQKTGTIPTGEMWYWQGINSSGTSITDPATSNFTVSSSGTYYIRSKNTSSGVWSTSSSSVAVTLGDTNCPVVNNFSDENYIYTLTPQVGVTNESMLTQAKESIKNITYYDGLGRPVQNIAIGQSGASSTDIITYTDYDDFGRQDKDWLPYVPADASLNGSYRTNNQETAINAYYTTNYSGELGSTPNPYSLRRFENSPLNRVLEQTAPGESWKAGSIYDGNGHSNGQTIKFGYQTNTTNEVRLYTVTLALANNTYAPSLVNATTYYLPNELYKSITKDENWKISDGVNKTTEEFKDKQGRLVLKRTYNAGIAHDTYYVYDDFGNLTYVLPPKMEPTTAIVTTINGQLDELGYQYKYDHRNRLVEKKIPGKQWEFIVYDNLNRPIATGPALSPFSTPTGNGWLITKYDIFDRAIITAWLPATTVTSAERISMQNARNTETNYFSETKIATTANTTINGVSFRYTNVVFPTSGYHVLTVNYFDDYNFPDAPAIPGTIETQAVYYNTTIKPKGLATGSWTRVLETSSLYNNETAYLLYDRKARIIRSYTKNHMGGYTYVDSRFDFPGKPEYIITKHKLLSTSTEITTREDFEYTAQGRLQSQTHQINGGTKQLIAKNSYDELGQLISKKVGGTDATGATGLQTVDYTYNIRGWLKQINNPTTLGTDLFGFKINYNTVGHGATPLYNGNISETEWKTQSDNSLRWYKYGYDNLNRITSGIDNTSDTRYSLSSVAYDKNGNIANLTRKGQTDVGATTFGVMDQLTYTYQANSNKLTIVSDAGNDTFGFKDDQIGTGADITTDYTYDANGNMLADANKGITAITYNHLNLPTKVTFSSGNIQYIYNATGIKLEKMVTVGSAITRTKYAGDFIYEKTGTGADVLVFLNTPEGYVEPVNASNYNLGFKYVYQYKDQIENVRLSYSDLDGNGSIDPNTEILHERNYYPFGLLHRGYNNVISGTENNLHQYQDQEFTEDLGLNVHEWKYRFSDPAIGRFWSVDPLADIYSYQSPYNFSENRVIDAFELEGLEKVSIHTRAFAPFKTFGIGFSGDGADRRFTTSQNVTSRVKQSVNIDFDQSRPVVSGGTQTSDPSHHPLLGTETAPDRDALKNVQIGETLTGAKQVSFLSEIEGANPLTPESITPNIDVDGIFSISSNQEEGILNISAIITGDNFPSTESFISDSAGNSVFIGVSTLKGGPFSSLKGEGGREMINKDLRINFNADGVFQNVIYQGQQYNIQDYNKLFETQNPNGN